MRPRSTVERAGDVLPFVRRGTVFRYSLGNREVRDPAMVEDALRHVGGAGAALALVLALLPASAPAGEFVGSTGEYALIGGALLGAAAFEHWPVNRDHPLIGGGQKSYVERERVPDYVLVAAHLTTFGAMRFGADDEGVRYAHGYLAAISLNQFGTSFVKSLVGRRRPNHDAAKALGKSTKSRGFYSGHASNAFCLATYATLYTWHRTDRLLVRSLAPFVLYAGASYTAWSRVAEHRHYPSDVLSGAAAGSLVAALVYHWYDGMTGAEKQVHLLPGPAGFAVAVSF